MTQVIRPWPPRSITYSSSSPTTLASAIAERAFDPANPRVPGLGQGVRRRGGGRAGAHQPRLLADRRPRARGVRARPGARTGQRHALMVNSGSSANLLAVIALTSPRLGERRLLPGRRGDHRRRRLPDDGEPDRPERPRARVRRRVAPDLQRRRRAARGRRRRERTRAVVLAHTLGNPFDLDAVGDFCRRHGLLPGRGLLRRARRDATTASPSAPSATWRRSRSIPPTRSRPARAARCSRNRPRAEADRRVDPRLGPRLLVRPRLPRTPAASASTSSTGRCRPATTTSTSTRTSATT